jgi:CheY-like chemotaxis protein
MTEKAAPEHNPANLVLPTKALTLLLVEDELISREMLSMCAENLFKQVYVAADGNEGYQFFCEYTPDIVLTDQMMPGLSGLGLMRKIRATGAKTPVVLMTSSIDNDILLEAINTGVERFIPKPFDFNLITRTLTNIADEIVNARLADHHRQQEVELLRCRDAYNSMQQESARRKERHVVRHDLRDQILNGAEGIRWGVNVDYSPHDIMCGDGYSVRNLFDGRQLIFIVDAMGSGMSASLTAMLATSFFNYQVENLHLWETFTLRIFLKRFKEYLTSMLLEDEALSCGFFLVNLVTEEIKTALFGMPPLLLRNLDGSVKRICGENPPLGIYPSETRISTISLSGVADLLVMTDGVTDALLTMGGSYREELECDFRKAPTLTALLRRFKKKTDQETSDDLTLMHLRRLDFDAGWIWKSLALFTHADINRSIHEFLLALNREVALNADERKGLEESLTEVLTNSFEQSCLSIEHNEKNRSQHMDEYKDTLEKRITLPDATITFSGTLWRGSEKPLLLMEIRDNCLGLSNALLDMEIDDTSVDRGGLKTISRFSDSLFIDQSGETLIILKTLEGGYTDAN